MRNILIAIVVVIAATLTFLLMRQLTGDPIILPEPQQQEEEDSVEVASGEYLEYTRFDPQYYTESRIIYYLHEQDNPSLKALDENILANLDLLPQELVIVKTSGTDLEVIKSDLDLNEDTMMVEVDAEGKVVDSWTVISNLSQLLSVLGYN